MPPGLARVAVAALGAVAVAAGLVATLNGVLAGLAIAAAGAVLVTWSMARG